MGSNGMDVWMNTVNAFLGPNNDARKLGEAVCICIMEPNLREDSIGVPISPVAADLLEENGYSELAAQFRGEPIDIPPRRSQ